MRRQDTLSYQTRLETPLTLVKGARNNEIKGYSTIGKIFELIQDENNKKLVEFSNQLLKAKKTSAPQYRKLKENNCPGFILGHFKERNDNGCAQYTPLLGFDIDNLSTHRIRSLLDKCKESPHIFAAFPSPSHQGMRLLLWCDSTQQTHKVMYKAGCEYLSNVFNLPTKRTETGYIDTSTKNLSRIWFYTHVPSENFYINLESTVFVAKRTYPQFGGTKPPTHYIHADSINGISLTEDEKVRLVQGMAKRRNIPDGRNNYIHFFAHLLREHGISEQRVYSECLEYAEPDFTPSEIKDTVRKAVAAAEVGKFSDQQLLRYKMQIEGGQPSKQPEVKQPVNQEMTVENKWSDFRYVGDYFFERIPIINETGRIVGYELVDRQKQTLQNRFPSDFKNLLEHLRKSYYHGFTNRPDNFDYEECYEIKGKRFYNRYSEVLYRPRAGDCTNTLNMIKHIFGEEKVAYNGQEFSRFTLGLDYVQLLLTNPIQKLPVLILYSKERGTGKSTFPIWLNKILGNNSVKVSSDSFSSDFNESFADKLLIYCDETLLDKKPQAERIKDLSTSPVFLVNPKGRKTYTIPFFAKFIFTSNNKNMIYVDKDSERFWIIEVQKLENDDSNFVKKLEQEIPAFLHFIKNRKLVSTKESRMHFHKDLIRTEAFYQTVAENEPKDVVELRESIEELFRALYEEGKNVSEIRMPLKDINQEFFNGRREKKWIKKILIEYFNLKNKDGQPHADPQERGEYFILEKRYNGKFEDDRIIEKGYNGRPYVFKVSDFCPDLVSSS